jgi:hypothetical protein
MPRFFKEGGQHMFSRALSALLFYRRRAIGRNMKGLCGANLPGAARQRALGNNRLHLIITTNAHLGYCASGSSSHSVDAYQTASNRKAWHDMLTCLTDLHA